MQIPTTITQCGSTESSDVILLVQGDTNPSLIVSLTNEEYNSISGNTTITPIDVSNANVFLKLRKVTSNTIFATVEGDKLSGIVNSETGEVSYLPPYDEFGKGGRVSFQWKTEDLIESGLCEGEIKIYHTANSIQTVYSIIPIKIREQF